MRDQNITILIAIVLLIAWITMRIVFEDTPKYDLFIRDFSEELK